MQHDPSLTSRRSGIAGAAAFLLAALPRRAAARKGSPPPCCGNGPPNTARYGVGTQLTPLQPGALNYEFKSPFFGKGGDQGVYIWVFTSPVGIVATSYTDPNGMQQAVISYTNPQGFTGTVFLVAPGFTLDLHWPILGGPFQFSTRPLGNTE